MNCYQKVGKGIRLVFIGQICGVLSLYEIMVAISLLFFMAGLYLAARAEKKLWVAFWLEAGTLLLAVLETWFFYFPSLELIGVALHILGVFCICTVTSALLDEIGAGDTARWGRAVWKIYAGGRIGLYVFSDTPWAVRHLCGGLAASECVCKSDFPLCGGIHIASAPV